jgi:UPF0755 protein
MRKILVLVLLAAAVAGAWYWERQNFTAPGPSQKYTVVLVRPGDHVVTIARHLADAGVVRNADLFRVGLRLRNLHTTLKAGEFMFPPHASMASVAGIIASGRSIQHKQTVAEGLTSEMVVRLLEANPVLVGAAGAVPAEGTLLPETYLFTRGTTRAELIARMKAAQAKLLAQLWPARARDLPLRTPQEAVTLASMVEKETSIPEERRHIAGVFVNRLRLGMRLQSDPTIIYDITGGYPLGRGIRQSELERASPHNTYAIDGLPPSPICNPGKDAIAAVLDPAATRDLYFVADGSGGHAFSETQAGQNRNVTNWRRIERDRKRSQLPVPHPRR